MVTAALWVVGLPGAANRQEAAAPPAGRVHVSDRALADARGPFTVLGATLFWGAWGYRHDRARLEENLAFLTGHGVDAVRVLAAVGPSGGWEDRTVDPAWPDYDEVIAGLTDFAFDRHGLRVQWTIFGGVDATPAADSRAALVDRVARLLEPRADKVLFVEIANEGYQNGFGEPGGLEELRGLGRRLADASPLLVSLTAPQNDPDAPLSPAGVYRGAGVDIGTLHHDRDTGGEQGSWRPVRAPWTVLAMRDDLPPVLASNEPIGPGSSVADESDPARLAGAALLSWLSGHSVYVFHAGPGVRGGGAADLARGRSANFFDAPATTRQLDALAAAQHLVPPDIANWTPIPSGDSRHPFRGADDVFCAARDAAFTCAVLAPDGPRSLVASAAMRVTAHDPVRGVRLETVRLEPGAALHVSGASTLTVLSAVALPQE